MDRLRSFLEVKFFGVCSYLGEKLQIPSGRIRLFFIYSSFVAAGSPVLIYLALAFLLKLRDYTRNKRNAVWDF